MTSLIRPQPRELEIKAPLAAAARGASWCAPAHAAKPRASDESAAYRSARAGLSCDVALVVTCPGCTGLWGLENAPGRPARPRSPGCCQAGRRCRPRPASSPCAGRTAGRGRRLLTASLYVQPSVACPTSSISHTPADSPNSACSACVPGRRPAGPVAAAEAGAARRGERHVCPSCCTKAGGQNDRFDGRQPVAQDQQRTGCECRACGKATDSRHRSSSKVRSVRPEPAGAGPWTRRIATGPDSAPQAGCSSPTPCNITAQRRRTECAVHAAKAASRRHAACVRAPCAVYRALPHRTTQPSRPGADEDDLRLHKLGAA